MLDFQPPQRHLLFGGSQLWLRLFRNSHKPVPMPPLDLFRLAARLQALRRILPHHLQQTVTPARRSPAPRTRPATCPPERSAGPAPARLDALPATHLLRRFQGPAAGKHRQPPQQRPLRLRAAEHTTSPASPAASADATAPCGSRPSADPDGRPDARRSAPPSSL